MSLLDALLNDSFRPSQEIWLAGRTDGEAGSGTLEDPYDGGTRPDASFSGTVNYISTDVIISTTVPHGYTGNPTIKISG